MGYNLALRGGAAKVLRYSEIVKELENKPEVKFDTISGASGGALEGAIIACGYNFAQNRDMLLELKYDEYMKASEKAEKSNNPFVKFANGLKFFSKRHKIFNNMLGILEKYLSYDKMTRANTFYACVVPLSQLAKVAGLKKRFTFKDVFQVLKAKGPYEQLARLIQPEYLSNKGIFRYQGGKLMKISDTIVPMHIAVMGSIWNPVFPEVEIPIETARGREIYIPFDGGIANNEANLVFPDDNYHQVLCYAEAPETPTNLSDWYYNRNRAHVRRVHQVRGENPAPAFFAFYDENIRLEFADSIIASNIFT